MTDDDPDVGPESARDARDSGSVEGPDAGSTSDGDPTDVEGAMEGHRSRGPPGDGQAVSEGVTDGPAGSGGVMDDHVESGRVPDVAGVRDHVVEELVRFGETLRRAGVAVPADATITAARALVAVGFEREPARAALRASLLTRPDDVPVFDRLFPQFWTRLTGVDQADLAPDASLGVEDDSSPDLDLEVADDLTSADGEREGEADAEGVARLSGGLGETDPREDADPVSAAVYSRAGASEAVSGGSHLVGADFGDAMERFTRGLAELPGRRWGRVSDGRRIDARRALRESVATGGAVLNLPRAEREPTAVRACLLVDVSKSVLDTLDRAFLLEFLRRARTGWRSARVFFFDTDLREVSTAFDAPTTAAATAALADAEAEWGGGTRIGHTVTTLREAYPEAVDRRTVVLVVSDGLEVGDLEGLESGMAWLDRRAATVLWLNPLARSPDYRPICRGMAAALPYVEALFAFAGPEDVAEVARQFEQYDPTELGYENDPRRQ